MSRIVVIGDALFVTALRELGWDVIHASPESKDAPLNLHEWTADRIRPLLHDSDTLFISGAISPVVFPASLPSDTHKVISFVPDSTLHTFWWRRAASSTHKTLIDQPDDSVLIPGNVDWLPLCADPLLYHKSDANWQDRDIPILFVGTVDPLRRPKRSYILKQFQSRTHVKIVDGSGVRAVPAREVANLYRRAKIVLNENMFSSVNLRMFEAMACGATLLTERANGLPEKLFQPGKHFLTYDYRSLPEQIDSLQSTPDKQLAEIAHTGSEEVHDKHLLQHRAATVSNLIQTTTFTPQISPPWKYAGVPVRMSLRWREHPQTAAWQQGYAPLLDDPTEFDEAAWIDRASILFVTNHIDRVGACLRNANAAHPTSIRLHVALAWHEIAQNQARGTARLEALASKYLDEIPITEDRVTTLHWLSAILLQRCGCSFDAGFRRSSLPVFLWNAMEHYEAALQNSPSNSRLRVGFAELLQNECDAQFESEMIRGNIQF